MAHRGPTTRTTLHFDLRHCGATDDYQLHVSGELFDLSLHDDDSRATACCENAGLAAMPAEQLSIVTHFAKDIPLPADLARFVYVTKKVTGLAINELSSIALCAIHVPSESMMACRRLTAAGATHRDHGLMSC